MSKTAGVLVFSVASLVCATVTEAADDPSVRDALRDKGVEFGIDYISQTASNVQGGARQLWRYADQWAFGTTLNLEKLFGLSEAQFNITLTDRNGDNLSNDAHLESLQEVQGIYGRGQTWHWTQFSYDQKYLDGLLDWKIGRLVGGEDFADFPCEFLNLALCGPPPGNIAVDYWYNWPVSQWATRLRVSFKGFGYVQLGAFEANPRYLATKNGLNLGEPGGATGVLVPLEVAWQPTFGDRVQGTYKFGGWYNSSRAPDVTAPMNRSLVLFDGEQARARQGAHGEYVNFLQRVRASAGDGVGRAISVFLNATFADRRTSPLDSQIALGMFIDAPLRGRAADKVGLAFGRTHVNSRIAAAQELSNTSEVQRSEYVGEIFYGWRAGTWLELRPSVQYVYRPGGIASNTNDVIVGLMVLGSL